MAIYRLVTISHFKGTNVARITFLLENPPARDTKISFSPLT